MSLRSLLRGLVLEKMMMPKRLMSVYEIFIHLFIQICFEQVEELLSEADEKCEPSTMSVSWDDLRLSTKYVLARYSGSLTHVKVTDSSLRLF
jgi:hypothetical protein